MIALSVLSLALFLALREQRQAQRRQAFAVLGLEPEFEKFGLEFGKFGDELEFAQFARFAQFGPFGHAAPLPLAFGFETEREPEKPERSVVERVVVRLPTSHTKVGLFLSLFPCLCLCPCPALVLVLGVGVVGARETKQTEQRETETDLCVIVTAERQPTIEPEIVRFVSVRMAQTESEGARENAVSDAETEIGRREKTREREERA